MVKKGPGMGAERGYTYIWILFTVGLAGIILATAGQVWQTEAWRKISASRSVISFLLFHTVDPC